MKENIVVREYRPEDLTQVIEVVRDIQRHEGSLYGRMLPPEAIGEWYVEKQLQDCARTGGAILVAEAGGRVVGYTSLQIEVSSEEDRDETDYLFAYVPDLGVAQAMRGKGIGTALLAACEERARRAGREWVRLSVLAANGDAHKLYRRLGYDPHIIMLEKHLD